METVTFKDLMKLGFKENQAHRIVRQAKQLLVQKGYGLYNGKRIGVVPAWVVSEIIAIHLEEKEDDSNGQH